MNCIRSVVRISYPFFPLKQYAGPQVTSDLGGDRGMGGGLSGLLCLTKCSWPPLPSMMIGWGPLGPHSLCFKLALALKISLIQLMCMRVQGTNNSQDLETGTHTVRIGIRALIVPSDTKMPPTEHILRAFDTLNRLLISLPFQGRCLLEQSRVQSEDC